MLWAFTVRSHRPVSLKSVFFLFLFRLSNCLFPFTFTNNFGVFCFFLLHVTLIFYISIFRLQSVYSVCPCQDSNFHAFSKSQKLNSVYSWPVHLVPAHWTHSLLPSASHLTSRSLLLPENGVPVLVRVTFRSSWLRSKSATGRDLKVIY